MIRRFSFIIFSSVSIFMTAQSITGLVLDGRTDRPLPNVLVKDETTGEWISTDSKGSFTLPYNAATVLNFTKSGWIEETLPVSSQPSANVQVKIFPASIRINEVTITAKKKEFSSIEISEEALQKIQSFSIGDVLQQLPGQYIKPLANTVMSNIVLRSANTQSLISTSILDQDFGNKAFGTQLMINNVAMSNNANMQEYHSSYSDPFQQLPNSFYVATGKGTVEAARPNFGTDLRQIPTEDIERIEVIAGVPDAKYGDLTSGLIKVETKTGRKPFVAFLICTMPECRRKKETLKVR